MLGLALLRVAVRLGADELPDVLVGQCWPTALLLPMVFFLLVLVADDTLTLRWSGHS